MMPDYVAIRKPSSGLDAPRDTIGGNPFLNADMEPPRCRNCGALLILFFQFDIRAEFSLPFQTGSHFVVMMCPNCNDVPWFTPPPAGALPSDYWDSTEGHFFSALFPPGNQISQVTTTPCL